MAGVVGACALGVALGFWARPATPGEAGRKPAPRAAPAALRPPLQIVVDDAPAPLGRPLDVLPDDVAASGPVQTPEPVEPAVPRRPASGLMKVDTPVAAPEVVPQLAVLKPAPKPKLQLKAEAPKAKVAMARPAKAKPVLVKAVLVKPATRSGPDPRLAKAKLAEAAKARKAAVLAEARAEKLERAKAVKLAASEARSAKAKPVKLAKAAPRHATAAIKVQVKSKPAAAPRRLAVLLKAVRIESRQPARPKAIKVVAVKAAAVKVAASKPVRQVRKPAAVVARAAPPPKRIMPRGTGPMRVARANICASPDPGEAIVCADSRLGARDRQLQQAYRSAEAAGVPATALRRQQSRWLQARAAAAREAPWAVEDVYIARISELKDQVRDAEEE
jgi:hypothetical protein